jgi:hypothetical protein
VLLKCGGKGGVIPLEVGERLWTGELEEAIGGSAGKLSVRPVPMIPVGEDFMKGLMAAVGDRGRLLSTVGGADEMELGRKMVTSVLEGLLEEKNLQWAAVASLEEGGEVVKAAMQAAGMKLGSGGLGSGAGGVEKLRRLADVVRDLLEFLSRGGVVMRGGRAGWSLRVEHTLSLRAAHWFFSRGLCCMEKCKKARLGLVMEVDFGTQSAGGMVAGMASARRKSSGSTASMTGSEGSGRFKLDPLYAADDKK